MPNVAQGNKVLLGRGKVYFDRLDASGASTGLRFMGTVSELAISGSQEKREIRDFSLPGAPVLAEAVIASDFTLRLTAHEFTRENLALAFMGDEAGLTQSSGSVVDEVLATTARKSRAYQCASRKISAVTVKEGAATLVAGTDYEVSDADAGMIYITDAAPNVTGTGNLTISYTKAAIASPGWDKVRGAMQTAVRGRVLYLGDPATGPRTNVNVWRVSLSPEGDVGFIGDDFAGFQLSGKIESDATNHPTEPFFVVEHEA